MWKLGVCSFVFKISISWKCNSVLAQISELPNGSWIPFLWRLTPLCCSKDDVNLELFIADFCGLRHFRYIPFCALCLNDITHFCSWNKLVINECLQQLLPEIFSEGAFLVLGTWMIQKNIHYEPSKTGVFYCFWGVCPGKRCLERPLWSGIYEDQPLVSLRGLIL